MHRKFLFFCVMLVVLSAEGSWTLEDKAPKPASTASPIDACSLLTSAEVQAVQGEAVSATKGNVQNNGSFDVYQCFYGAPTFSRSVALEVIRQKQKPEAMNLRNFWDEKFHRAYAEADEEEAEHAGKDTKPANRPAAREEKEKEGPKLRPVSGVGEQAYWSGTGITAALYVLHGEHILRISIGGPEDDNVKINKAKVLAQDALRRM